MESIGTGPAVFRTPKLIADLHHKTNYIAHYSTLQQYLKMGVKITRLYRAIEFTQERWMKPYIDFNTEQRSKARNDFEKNFWKLMNNRYAYFHLHVFVKLIIIIFFVVLSARRLNKSAIVKMFALSWMASELKSTRGNQLLQKSSPSTRILASF
jgi:hypothetical protein